MYSKNINLVSSYSCCGVFTSVYDVSLVLLMQLREKTVILLWNDFTQSEGRCCNGKTPLLNPVFKFIKTEVVFSTGDADSGVLFGSSSLWWTNISIISIINMPIHDFCHLKGIRILHVKMISGLGCTSMFSHGGTRRKKNPQRITFI